jgi:hypothetical protein
VFEGKTSIGLKDFIEFNTSVTSEMFISVMSILHERLPCSEYVFKQRKTFKQQEVNRNKTKISEVNKYNINESDYDIKAEEMCMSPLKAIASPSVIVNWQPKRHNSTFKPKSFN